LLPLKGVCFFSRSRARMHSFKARSDLLISAPSILVYRFWSIVSAPLSLPAKSMKDILPCSLYSLTFLSWNWRIAWERELSALAPVWPLVRDCSPLPIILIICCTLFTVISVRPTTHTFCFASSRQCKKFRLFKRSYSFPQ
jgi:hypothetical protein